MKASLRAGKFDIPLLYEDNHLLVVVKPPNLPAQADRSGDEDLLRILKGYIGQKYAKPGNVYLGLVHRLDRPVGGVMVFARTSKAAARLSRAFSEHAQDRRYLAVLQGRLEAERSLEDWLLKGADGMVRVVPPDAPGAKRALLTTRPLAYRGERTLAEVTLQTGRSHQIRVQHAHAGLPLWGDARYGGGRPASKLPCGPTVWAWSIPRAMNRWFLPLLRPLRGAWRDFEEEIRKLL